MTKPAAVTGSKPSEHSVDRKAALVLSTNASFTVADDNLIVAFKLLNACSTLQELRNINFSLKPMASINMAEMAALLGTDKIMPPSWKSLNHASDAVEQTINRDDDYYLGMLNFEFEDVQFSVPRWGFSEISKHSTLILPQDQDNSTVTEEGVSATDFHGLMEFMYPLDSSGVSENAWSSVLKLASRWHIIDYRKLALSKLADEQGCHLPPEDMIVLGRSCGVPAWYMQGCIAFACGEPHLASQHEATIGIDAMIKIARARDAAYRDDLIAYHQRSPPPAYFTNEMLCDIVGRDTPHRGVGSKLVDDICTARANHLPGWLQYCYERLIDREESVTLEETVSLGLDQTIRLWKARLHLFQQYRNIIQSSGSAPGLYFASHIEAEFADEFAEAQLLQSTLDAPLPIFGLRSCRKERAWGSDESPSSPPTLNDSNFPRLSKATGKKKKRR